MKALSITPPNYQLSLSATIEQKLVLRIEQSFLKM